MTNTSTTGLTNRARAGFVTLFTTATIWATTAAGYAATDVPNPTPKAPPGLENKVGKVLDLIMWVGVAAVVAGFIFAGIALALAKKGRGHSEEGVEKVLFVCGGAIVIGSAASLAGWLL